MLSGRARQEWLRTEQRGETLDRHNLPCTNTVSFALGEITDSSLKQVIASTLYLIYVKKMQRSVHHFHFKSIVKERERSCYR